MVRVRFVQGQWIEGPAEKWVKESDRRKLRAVIAAHLGHRIYRTGEDLTRVVGRCYRVPQGLQLVGHLGLRWAEYDVIRPRRGHDRDRQCGRNKRARTAAVFVVRLVKLAPSPLPHPPIADPAGADSDQGVESPPSPVSSEF